MTEGERQEFDRLLDELFAAIGKPVFEAKREGFWKGLQRMSLVEFTRCRDLLLQDLEQQESPPKDFAVTHVWGAKRRLRARGSQQQMSHQEPLAEAWVGDDWNILANQHLMNHIRRSLAVNSRRYGDPGITGQVPGSRPHSREFERNVMHLVHAKNAWAADMRDMAAASADGVPGEMQKTIWKDLIERAETDIARNSNTTREIAA